MTVTLVVATSLSFEDAFPLAPCSVSGFLTLAWHPHLYLGLCLAELYRSKPHCLIDFSLNFKGLS